jgi:DNA repair protein RadA/Sms
MGKCTACGTWDSLQEEIISSGKENEKKPRRSGSKSPVELASVSLASDERTHCGIEELDRVLGGGMVEGAVVLIGGQPGIGKSTLMLQMALKYPNKVFYVSGEESVRQIGMRADRLGKKENQCWLFAETRIELIIEQIEKLKPGMVILDSIQTMHSDILESTAGTVSQIRLCTQKLVDLSKTTGIPVVLIGHITKEGSLAGPKILEHMVDVVLQFEGDQQYSYRILRTAKNRYGSTDEIGLFEMTQQGLREVSNPSELLLSQSADQFSGSAVSATMEGLRPMLIEVQALVSPAVYGNPQRSTTGFDMRRLSMLLAVLEKRVGFRFGQQDVFLNMAGGLRVQDPAADLAVVASLLSSFEDEPLKSTDCFAGEIGLSGEIRAIYRLEQRIREADRLGFKRIFVPKNNLKGFDEKSVKIQIVDLGRVEELSRTLTLT